MTETSEQAKELLAAEPHDKLCPAITSTGYCKCANARALRAIDKALASRSASDGGREEGERDLSGETVLGMRVAAYRWSTSCPPDVPQEDWDKVFPSGGPIDYASHWSTGPDDAERLFAENDVRDRLSTLRTETLEEAARELRRRADELYDGGADALAASELRKAADALSIKDQGNG